MKQYRLSPNRIESSCAGKDPGAPEDKQNISQPWALTAKNANGIVGCISKSVFSRLMEAIVPLYLACVRLHLGVRLHLEHHVQFWAPQYKKDTDILEQAQLL